MSANMPPGRTPVRPRYDAAIDLVERPDQTVVYAIVKLTYRIDPQRQRCLPAPAEPLLHDFRDPALDPRLPAGTDFWPSKHETDVVIQGEAFAPGHRPATEMTVRVAVGKRTKEIAVFGHRHAEWSTGGMVRFSPPEPFDSMPLAYDNAYGGIDARVVPDEDDPSFLEFMADCDHPGLYPRNPFGKGYVVHPEAPAGPVALPNLEDPEDLLTPERLIVGDPAEWHRQPLPWAYDWVSPAVFPRMMFYASDCLPWYPPPDDGSLLEEHRGFLPANVLGLLHDFDLTGPAHWRFRQEASYGMVFGHLPPGAPMEIDGLHPAYPEFRFSLPEAEPEIRLFVDGQAYDPPPHLNSVVVRPAEETLTLTYSATIRSPRMFLPGVHKRIPLALSVDRDTPIEYETPPTLRDVVAAARAGEQ